jgi:hypothetical protein
MTLKQRHRLTGLLHLTFLLTSLVLSADAFAVAGFARQTGMSCNQCHTSHGGATPNFTFTGKKVNALGYRVPQVQPADIEKGEPEDRGEYLMLKPSQWSGRFQWQGVSNVKPPAGPNAGQWSEEDTNPTSRFAVFPFIGPIGKHFGVWTEFYIVPLSSGNGEWSIANTSYEEHDFRYVINPDSDDNVYGLALTNQGIGELFGFGPWPAVGLDSYTSNRGGIGGYTHPNFANVFAYGWMDDRWLWAIGENTGDTNSGWSRSNELGMLGYAISNTNDNELWANIYFRNGNDALPVVTDISIPEDTHDFAYSDAVSGITATRPADCPSASETILSGCPYLAEDLLDHTSVDVEARWSKQDWGNWSFEIVGRVGMNSEDYRDGASADLDTWGIATQFGYKHTYYIKPYVNGRSNFEFTDMSGTTHDIDTSESYGIWFGYKPTENFLLTLEYHNLQAWSLNGPALDDGARYALTADVSF